MSGETNLTKLIASMDPVLSEKEFIFASLTKADMQKLSSLEPIGTFQESEGLTVILQKQQADQFNIPYSSVLNCITLNVHSSLDAVGLTAAFATTLTKSNISANVVAGYYHDHIFISVTDAERALAALKNLVRDGVSD
ncbi:MAG: ACT domain-containing protein [Pseudomonadales bacterium]|nr:ACT domain-containing protein [Pseudomonadales bacterium]